MVKFRKNVSRLLPYNRKQYKKFLFSDSDVSVKWYGISFQLPIYVEGKDVTLAEYIHAYKPFFEGVISKLDNGAFWIINHDKNDQNWFPDEGRNLPELRKLFNENNISPEFIGALIFSTNELLAYSNEIISYPYTIIEDDGWFYTDLDISHSKLPIVIKILDHLTVEMLSTDINYLKKAAKESFSSQFYIFEWNGTKL
jgi:hypothetical protein